MKLPLKITLINVALSILGGIIFSFQADGFTQALGLAFVSGSLFRVSSTTQARFEK